MAQSLTLNPQEFSSVNLRGTRLCAKMEVNLSHVYLKSNINDIISFEAVGVACGPIFPGFFTTNRKAA